jgi:Na+-transporting methylmalonyl-CoA/oxaloacetate decarboxylase beta subunit
MLNISLLIIVSIIIKCLQCNKTAEDVLVFCVAVVLGSTCRYIMINNVMYGCLEPKDGELTCILSNALKIKVRRNLIFTAFQTAKRFSFHLEITAPAINYPVSYMPPFSFLP